MFPDGTGNPARSARRMRPLLEPVGVGDRPAFVFNVCPCASNPRFVTPRPPPPAAFAVVPIPVPDSTTGVSGAGAAPALAPAIALPTVANSTANVSDVNML